MNRTIRAFLRDESGQTTTEYVLILAVVVTIFMQFRKNLVGIMKKLFTDLDNHTNDLICDPTNGDC